MPDVTVDQDLTSAKAEAEQATQQKMEREELDWRIGAMKKQIHGLANRSGLGRSTFAKGTHEPARLRKELAGMEE